MNWFTGNDQADALEIFGRNQSDQSRAVTWFINHTYIDLVADNLQWWYENGYMQKSMEAIKAKIGGSDKLL